jgi:DNA-binding GntR family transcriptional regulator
LSQKGRFAEAVSQHAELIEAIRDRDAARASKIAEDHANRGRDLRLTMLMNADA